MRTARLVGLSPDGRAVIVVTDNGEELSLPADDQLRAALRGDRPRLGQLEIEMDSALTPRDIQSRIRGGQSLEEVTRAAGIEMDRVERFAAPVLAERDHVARLAMSSSVRRRGETSAHRTLQATVTERLQARGVDLRTLDWDSYRLEDGHWAVTAAYRSGEAVRSAQFTFDVAGRFSIAANDDARWVLGEQTPTRGPQPGRRRPDGQPEDRTDPTLDLTDELALVRAIQDDPEQPEANTGARLASVQELRPTPVPSAAAEPDEMVPAASSEPGVTGDIPVPTVEEYRGLSDAAAVPDTVAGGWEPAIVVSYPVEPGPADAEDEPATDYHEPPPTQVLSPDQTPAVVPLTHARGTDAPGPPEQIVFGEDRRAEADALADEHEANVGLAPAARDAADPDAPSEPEPPAQEASAPAKGKRKRASVPSWDEIMFGGPSRPS